jgi:hypothetical protein
VFPEPDENGGVIMFHLIHARGIPWMAQMTVVGCHGSNQATFRSFRFAESSVLFTHARWYKYLYEYYTYIDTQMYSYKDI